jgi:hypothetical protein
MEMAFLKIDLQALESKPDVGILLQLLAAVNDVNTHGHIGRLVFDEWKSQQKRNEWTLDKFYESIVWQLFKSRISVSAEAIRSLVSKVKKAETTATMTEIWSLIRDNEIVAEHFHALEKYLPGPNNRAPQNGAGEHYGALANQLYVRDKMNSHNDVEPLLKALKTANEKHIEKNLPCDGWIQDGNFGEYTRALFVDNLQIIAWYQQHNVEPRFGTYDDDPQVEAIRIHTSILFTAFVNFVQELFGAYLKKHNLLKPAGKPEWIKNE